LCMVFWRVLFPSFFFFFFYRAWQHWKELLLHYSTPIDNLAVLWIEPRVIYKGREQHSGVVIAQDEAWREIRPPAWPASQKNAKEELSKRMAGLFRPSAM